MGSLSPEKASPFVRRPSQISSQATGRPSSPLARPPSTFGPPLRGVAMSKQARVESGSDAGMDRLESPSASPTRRISPIEIPSSPEPDSPSPLDGMRPPPVLDQPIISLSVPTRPTAQRIPTSSSIATLRQPNFNNSNNYNNSASSYASGSPQQKPVFRPIPSRPAGPTRGASAYTTLPPPLLHALRSSFEILDPHATGSITPTTLPETLEQIGLPAPNPAQLIAHFPPPHTAGFNLATYLDTLSAPLAQLSPPDELLAAFAAFDIDDSGQIDARELREALLKTGPEPGEEDYRMSEHEIDGVLEEFVGRRAFGAKGLNAAKGKGEVFRYRDFMGNLSGGSGGQEQEVMG
jgi:Ca2+-binding EF-hand superfamily protein